LKRVKLLLVAPAFYPTHGGAELRFFRYLPRLHECGVDVQVICGTPKYKKFTAEDLQASWRNRASGELISSSKVEHAQIDKFKLPEKNSVKRMRVLLDQTIAHCHNNKSKPEVIQFISPISPKLIGRLKVLKSMGIAFVFSYCLAHSFSSNRLIKAFQKYQVRRVYKNYDQIIVASKVLHDLVIDIFPAAKLNIIPNGIDTEKFSPIKTMADRTTIRKKLGLPDQATLIMSVGAVHPRKGTHLLVEAWSRLVDKHQSAHLILIGPRYDQTREELKEFKKHMHECIQNSGFQENIHFLGSVKNVDEYLKAADIFVFASKKEGMPNAVLEAMAVGLATVLVPFVGLSEDFGVAGEHYLLADRDSKSIASAIQSILEDQNKQGDLSRNARDWIINTTDLYDSVQQHATLYRSLTK
jgi:glycosyltransferase involved in cell wall biosynthesis